MRRVKFLVNDDNQLDLVFYGFVDVSFRLILSLVSDGVHELLTMVGATKMSLCFSVTRRRSKILRRVNISSEVSEK